MALSVASGPVSAAGVCAHAGGTSGATSETPAKSRSSRHPVRIEGKKRNLTILPLALSRLII